MKKYSITVLFFLSIYTLGYSFNWESYKPATLDIVVKMINTEKKELEEKKRSEGMSVFNEKLVLPFILIKYPVERKDNYSNELEKYGKVSGISGADPELFYKLFGYQLEFTYEGINFVLIFQNSLIEFLKSEIPLNEIVELYVIFGGYFDDGNKAILLVNEFQKIQKENKVNL